MKKYSITDSAEFGQHISRLLVTDQSVEQILRAFLLGYPASAIFLLCLCICVVKEIFKSSWDRCAQILKQLGHNEARPRRWGLVGR